MVQLLVTFICIAEPLASPWPRACLQSHCFSQVPSAFPKARQWDDGGPRCPLGLATKKSKLHLNLEIYRNAEQPCC